MQNKHQVFVLFLGSTVAKFLIMEAIDITILYFKKLKLDYLCRKEE